MRLDHAQAGGEPLTRRRSAPSAAGQIAHYKVPRYVRFVDDFPMTVTGKVQKFIMRAETAAELGLKEEKTA